MAEGLPAQIHEGEHELRTGQKKESAEGSATSALGVLGTQCMGT